MPAQATDTRGRDRNQRRQRIVAAASALTSRGGVDAMQMRAVAERAGVALGTLYRYFPSKMDLVAAVVAEELDLLQASIQHRPPTAPAPARRAVDVLMRATRGLMREPELADALLRSLLATDENVDTGAASRFNRLLLHASLGEREAAEADERVVALARALTSFWTIELLEMLRGRRSFDELQHNLETIAEPLLGSS